jgi:ABC-type transport system involved in multi-copper enzyme maturation permease subunit
VSRARVSAYAFWQMRDYLKDRGLSTLIVAGLSAYLAMSMMTETAPMPRPTDPVPAGLLLRFGNPDAVYAARMAEFSFHFMRSLLGAMIFLGALFAMNGIVANDRKQGYFRFLFAKPVTPSRYYGQAFVVHCAGFMLVMLLLGMLYGAIVWPVLTLQFVLVVGLMFVAYAGIAFLLSATARWDWLSLVVVSVAATFFWTKFGGSTHPLARLLYLLPPLHRVDEVYATVSGTPVISAAELPVVPWPLVAWFAAYGIICYLAGLVVLRYRRLAIV